ncbi:MAG: NUDIX domain-containing protein [Verrucomicrobia bacterium]|nr:NUDIX domain-containing protein [Verrucomicrobiota bacterium]
MSEFLNIASEVLRRVSHPMSANAIWRWAENEQMIPDDFAGKTPTATLRSKLSVHILRNGESSPFVRTASGKFYLRELLDSKWKPYQAARLEPPGRNEQVLVFKTELLDQAGRFQGIKKSCARLYRELLRPDKITYLPRVNAEARDDHKQIVTYVMVTSGEKLLAFKRGNYTRTDRFLRGSHCIGFGGHVVNADLTFFNNADSGVRDSAIRELSEELTLPESDRKRLPEHLELVGALNDDSSAVGRRHFAFIFRYEVASPEEWKQPQRGEKAVTELRWLDPTRPDFVMPQFEYWSQLCLRVFYAGAVRAEPWFFVRRRKAFTNLNMLCILGPVASGKTEATQVFKNDYNYSEVNSGRTLAGLLRIPPVPQTPRLEFLSKALKFIKTPTGPDRLATAMWEKAKALGQSRVLVDGIRNRATLDALRRVAGSSRLALIYIHTPADIAFDFYIEREGKPISIEEFIQIRESSVESEVVEMIEDADAVLYNWTGKPNYKQTIHAMIRDTGLHI